MDKLAYLKYQIEELQNEIDAIKNPVEKEGRSYNKDEQEKLTTLLDKIEEKQKEVRFQERIGKNNIPENKADGVITDIRSNADLDKYSLGEMLQDAVKAQRTNRYSPRLAEQQKRAISGMSETVPSDGGFLVDKPLSQDIFTKAYNNTQVASLCNRIPVGPNSNGFKIPYVDETSRVNGSRFGGTYAYWVGEGGTKTPSKSKLGLANFELNKMAVVTYATDELLQDATALQAIISTQASEELAFRLQDSIIEGDGVAKPLGVLNSPSLVTVAAEAGQGTTVIYENIVNMYSRLYAPSIPRAVWLINQDVMPQLCKLSLAVGTGGSAAYLPANGLSEMPFGTLMGRPVIPVEQCSTLGTVGDIMLCDFSQYYLAEKGGIQTATSIHVEFLDDETVFRWVVRVAGQPIWNSALTPFKGSNTQSPFIALATR